MALIKCTECNKEISDKAIACPHCGCPVLKDNPPTEENVQLAHEIEPKTTKFNKKTLCIGAIVVAVILLIITFALAGGNEIESSAKKYISQTKKIDDVEEINAVACIKNVTDEGEERFGYLILYINDDDESEMAYFLNDEYRGNGNNGGEAEGTENETFYNMGALNAVIKVLEFVDEEDLVSHSSYEEHFEIDEGIIYLKLYDVKEWIDNK